MNGLVLEGGAMRGMFTSGILDVFMQENITFDTCVGVSAGAVFGCNFKSRQIGRAIRYNKKYCNDKRYCSVYSLFTTGDLYGATFCYDTLPNVLDPFDYEAFENNPMDFWCVTTDVKSGKPYYVKTTKGSGDDMLYLRASASMPLVSSSVKVGGKLLLDGGISDPIPYRFMLDKKVDRCVVILTQPEGYIKKKNPMNPLFKLIYRGDKSGIARAMSIRHEVYNSQTEEIKKLEKEGKLFVIRPKYSLDIGKTEKDPEKLERVYQEGRRIAIEILPDLISYLS